MADADPQGVDHRVGTHQPAVKICETIAVYAHPFLAAPHAAQAPVGPADVLELNDLHPVAEALKNPRRKIYSLKASKNAADRLAAMAWDSRAEFEPELVPLEEAIRVGLSSPGTTVVADAGDDQRRGIDDSWC